MPYMPVKHWITTAVLLAPLYFVVGNAFYWLLWPHQDTLRIIYSHPYFCDRPCSTREEASKHQVVQVPSGTEFVWHYREYEIGVKRIGSIRSSWIDGPIIWSTPQIPTLGSPPGVYKRTVAIVPPTTAVTRDFVYQAIFVYKVNPLKDDLIEYPPIRLRIVAGDMHNDERKPSGTRY